MAMEGYEHVQRVRSRGLKTADLSYQGGRPNIRPTDKLKRPPSRLSNPIECASRQQVLRERTGGCSPDEYLSSLLALEITAPRRTTAGSVRAACADTANERREPAMGRAAHPRELLKLGFEVSQSSVAKYMVKRRGPPSQGWRAFLRNHAPDIAAMDLYKSQRQSVPLNGYGAL